MLACKPKGHWFDSQSRHMPGLGARSPLRGTREATDTVIFLSPSFSLLSPLSKKEKLNKIANNSIIYVQSSAIGAKTLPITSLFVCRQENIQIFHTEGFQAINILKEMKHPLSVGCARWLPSKEYSMERVRKADLFKTTSARWSRLTLTVINHVDSVRCDVMWHDLMWQKRHTWMNDCVFFPKTHNPTLSVGKTDKSQLKDILQCLPSSPQKELIRNKGILRNCHSQQEPKETWLLIVTCYLSCMGFWNAKWTLGKKQESLKYGL